MWSIKVLYSHQQDKLKDALADGWEPFSAVHIVGPPVTVEVNGRMKKKPKVQIFLRRNDEADDSIKELLEILTGSAESDEEENENTDDDEEEAKVFRPSLVGEGDITEDELIAEAEPTDPDEIIEEDDDALPEVDPGKEDDGDAEEEIEQPEAPPVLAPLENEKKEEPEPVIPDKQTPDQKRAIREIKRQEKTNVTISPVAENGEMVVIGGNRRYTVLPDGAWSFTDLRAAKK